MILNKSYYLCKKKEKKMNKLRMFMLVIMTLLMTQMNAQEKWRELSISSISGTTTSGNFRTTLSTNLSYELKNNWSISNWNGISYTEFNKQTWISSMATIDKRIKNTTIGAGASYGVDGMNNTINTIPFNDSFFFIIKLNYRIKL